MNEIVPEAKSDILDSLIKDPKIRRVLAVAALSSIKGMKYGTEKAAIEFISLFSGYQDYLSTTLQRVSMIKTFAAPTKPVPLLNHFVGTQLSGSVEAEINECDLLELIADGGKRIVVSAFAGFGKSVLMRYLALSMYENPRGQIPIFIELRDLNRMKSPDIITYIHATYKQSSNIDQSVFKKGLEKGLFSIFLDGFDEINFDIRDEVQRDILSISSDYPKISLLVSSRPDPKFSSWREFTSYEISPMTLDQVRDLIEKIDYDDGLKSRFIEKIEGGLYEKHRSFLSTPLLATLMMLTYQQNANIPDKMHSFYHRAFETLFDKHDTYKEQYERKRKSNLRIDEFARMFAVFCMNTYLEEKFEFSKTGILEAIDVAISYCGYQVSSEDVLFDLVESVCLMQLEGLFYSFVHRSFQEYFSALFLCNCQDSLRDEFLDSFVFRPWDSVLVMLFDMIHDRIESSWVVPRIDKYLDAIEKDGDDIGLNPLYARWSAFRFVETEKGLTFNGLATGPFSGMLHVLSRFYPDFALHYEYFSIDDIDILGSSIAKKMNKKYVNYRIYARNQYKSKGYISADLNKYEECVRKCDIFSKSQQEYLAIKSIRQSVGDHLLIKQKFLGKLFNK